MITYDKKMIISTVLIVIVMSINAQEEEFPILLK